jgi:hypothetical protein
MTPEQTVRAYIKALQDYESRFPLDYGHLKIPEGIKDNPTIYEQGVEAKLELISPDFGPDFDIEDMPFRREQREMEECWDDIRNKFCLDSIYENAAGRGRPPLYNPDYLKNVTTTFLDDNHAVVRGTYARTFPVDHTYRLTRLPQGWRIGSVVEHYEDEDVRVQ